MGNPAPGVNKMEGMVKFRVTKRDNDGDGIILDVTVWIIESWEEGYINEQAVVRDKKIETWRKALARLYNVSITCVKEIEIG